MMIIKLGHENQKFYLSTWHAYLVVFGSNFDNDFTLTPV